MKSIITKISSTASLFCLATSLTAQINDLTPTANPSTICAGESSTISVPNSQNGVTYYLRNGNSVVGNPMPGNNTTLNFGTGNLNNTTTFNVVGDVNNYALDFDGINDKVTTTYTVPATATLTIEAWIFPRKTTGNRYFSSYSGGAAFGNGELLLDNVSTTLNGQGLRFIVATAGNITSSVIVDNVVTLNAWNHVAATFNNGTMKLFVGGVEVASANASFLNIASIASTLTLGEDRTTTGVAEYFDGKMDEVRIWTTARTAAELAANKDACLNGNETGLSAYYRMNDYQNNAASEVLGNKNGVLTNMSIYSDWVWGAPLICTLLPPNPDYALDFDGTNDRVTTNFNLTSSSNNLTIEAWIYPRGTAVNRFISNYSGGGAFLAGEFLLDNASSIVNGRGLRFIVATSGNITSTASANNVLILNTWNHVAAVFNNGTMRLHVNGSQVTATSATFTSVAASSATLTLGEDRSLGASEFFNGMMDEVRVWNTARTAPQLLANKNNCVDGSAGLIAYYKLDDYNSSTASEEIANDNGTLSNMDPAFDWVSGVNKTNCSFSTNTPHQDLAQLTALNFNGTNSRVNLSYLFPGSNGMTIETWLYPRATGANRYISSYSGSSSFLNGAMVLDNVSSIQNGQGLRYIVATTGGTIHTLSVDNVVTLNTWNHVAVTFDAGVIKLYVNGVEVATNTASFSSIAYSGSSVFTLGEDYGVGVSEYFDGKMDEVRIWTVARTASEILNNRNSCLLGTETGLSLYHQFSEGQGNNAYDLVYNNPSFFIAMPNPWVANDGLLCNNSNFDDMQLQMSQTVTITVNQPAMNNQTLNECAGFSITVGSNTYTSSGTYMDTLVAANGCDSVVTTNLTVANPIDLNATLSGTTLTANQAGATYQWLDCNNGNAPIAGATNQSFEPTANGDYAVEITVGNCTETTSCFNVTGVGIDQIANPITWSVFPNPTSNKLNIKTSEWTNIAIVNVLGQEMHTQQVQGTATIDISNFENGVYFVRNLNNNSVVKIVKN